MIEVERLGKRFAETWALREVDLRVEKGETLGLMGRSGAGRSTLLALLATLIRPTSGRITVDGLDSRTRLSAVRRRIGFVPQEASVDEPLTVREQLEFAAAAGSPGDAGRGDVETVLAWTELPPAARIDRLGAGQSRLLALAAAFVRRPPVMLLDEPLSQLDPITRQRVAEKLGELARGGTTSVVALSRCDDARRLCGRLAVLAGGRLAGVIDASGDADLFERRVRSLMDPAADVGVAPARRAVGRMRR